MKNEKLNRFPIYFFSVGVLLNCLFFTTAVLDYTLSPRFIFLSFFILVFFIYIYFSFNNIKLSIDGFILPYFLFTLFSLASNFWSINTSLSIVESSKTILYFFVFIVTYRLLKYYHQEFLSTLFKTILILFFISTLQVIVQLLDLPEISRKYLYILTGTSGHKNLYSSFVFLCSIFSFIGFFHLKSFWKFISLIAIVCQVLLIVILQTRAVWVGCSVFLFSGLLIFLLHKKIKSVNYKSIIVYIVSSLILLNVFFIYALPHVLNIYNNHKPVSYNVEEVTDLNTVTERVLVWEKTYNVFYNSPLLGVGANNWQINFPGASLPDIYPVKDLNFTFQRPHNDFLWILSEYGVIGFNLFFLFIITILFFLLFEMLNHFKISSVIILAGVLGFFSISFFDFPKERIEHNILFAIILGMAYFIIKKEAINTRMFTLPKFGLQILIVGFTAIFYFAFLNFKGEYFTKKMYVERMKKNNTEVIALCDNALSFCYTIDPTSVPLSWYRGNANANLGNYPAALADFKNAFHAHPYNHYVLNDLGSSYFMNKNIDSAKIFFMESARINPRFDDPKLNLTVIYINEGNYKEAKKWNESIFHDSERRNYYRGIINEHK